MCGIDIFVSVQFQFGFEKWNEFGSVRFQKYGSVQILELFASHLIVE